MRAITAAFFSSANAQVPVSSTSSRGGNAAEASVEKILDASDTTAQIQETAGNCNKLQHSSPTVRRVSVTEISPLPKTHCGTQKRRGKKADLLTSTPHKKLWWKK